MPSELLMLIRHDAERCSILCAGGLDGSTSGRLRATIDLTLASGPPVLLVDGSALSSISGSGIETFLYALGACRNAAVRFELILGPDARRLLDLADLWWLGVVDDGRSIEVAIRETRRVLGDLGLSPEGNGSPAAGLRAV